MAVLCFKSPFCFINKHFVSYTTILFLTQLFCSLHNYFLCVHNHFDFIFSQPFSYKIILSFFFFTQTYILHHHCFLDNYFDFYMTSSKIHFSKENEDKIHTQRKELMSNTELEIVMGKISLHFCSLQNVRKMY